MRLRTMVRSQADQVSTAKHEPHSRQHQCARPQGVRFCGRLSLCLAIAMGELSAGTWPAVAAEFSTSPPSPSLRPPWAELQRCWNDWLKQAAPRESMPVATPPQGLSLNRRPLYQFTLVSGETFLAEWPGGDGQRIAIRRGRSYRARLPREVVQSIAMLPGTELVWHQAGRLSVDSGESRFTKPVASGSFQAWPLILSVPDQSPTSATCRLMFVRDDLSPQPPLELVVAATHEVTITLPAGWTCTARQSWRPAPGTPVPLSVQWSGVHWTVLRGDVLLARGTKPADSLVQVECPGAVDSVLWEDAYVCRHVSDEAVGPLAETLQDALELNDGSILYGRWQETTTDNIVLSRGTTRSVIPRQEVRKLTLRTSADWQTDAETEVRGPVMQMLVPAVGGFAKWPEQRLIGGARQMSPRLILVDHPWLGPRFPVDDAVSTRVLTSGTWRWLHPGTFHLGDEIRNDLQPAVPEGTQKSGQWTMTALPDQSTFFSVEIVDLEPSGAATPVSQPFLSSLRVGELVTELWVNDHRVGPLNDWLTWRPGAADPARIRIPIPREFLRVGRNSWELRQHPDGESGGYDDVQFGRIALEYTRDRTE